MGCSSGNGITVSALTIRECLVFVHGGLLQLLNAGCVQLLNSGCDTDSRTVAV